MACFPLAPWKSGCNVTVPLNSSPDPYAALSISCVATLHIFYPKDLHQNPKTTKNAVDMNPLPLSTFEKCLKPCSGSPEFLQRPHMLLHTFSSLFYEAMINIFYPKEPHQSPTITKIKPIVDPFPLSPLQSRKNNFAAVLQPYPDSNCSIIQSHLQLGRPCCTSLSQGPPIKDQKWPKTLPK